MTKNLTSNARWLAAAVCVFISFGLAGCTYEKNIQEFPEPWKTLEPGKPLEKFPRFEVVTQGGGKGVEPGDLVQLQLRLWLADKKIWLDRGDWWLWTGFRSAKETAFYSYAPELSSALVGLRQGSSLKFLEGLEVTERYNQGLTLDKHIELYPHPLGDHKYYSWKKNVTDFMSLHAATQSNAPNYQLIEIKRVCKGQAQYRTVRLYDDGPYRVWRGLDTFVSHEPREIWVDEAKIEAKCQDGRKAIFQYGPLGSSSGGKWRVPFQGYFDKWFSEAWDKLPVGVQFEGNRPPVVRKWSQAQLEKSHVTTLVDTPVHINLLDYAKDPDGDPLRPSATLHPEHGKLTINPDSSFTYTPDPGWTGGESFHFKVSDGLVESDYKVQLGIGVLKNLPTANKK